MSGTDYNTTTNLGLYKPIFNRAVGQWGDLWNSNADTLDAALSTGAGGLFLPLAGGTMAGGISMAGHLITDVNAPINPLDLANKAYVDTMLPLAGGTMTGGLMVTATGASTSRSVQNRWGEHLSVMDFGAVADGVTDDTAALQAAVNAVQANGGTVSIGRHILRINGTVNVPRNVRLTGAFRHAAMGYNPDWYSYGGQLRMGPSGTISLSSNQVDHIFFIAANLYTTPPANASDAQTIVNNFAGTAITAPSTVDTMIEGCLFLGFTTAINAAVASRINVVDCLFDCTNGIYAAGGSDVCHFHRLHFWPLMTIGVSGVGNDPLAYLPLQRTGYAMKFDTAPAMWPQCVDCFQFGYNQGFWCNDQGNAVFTSCHSDYTNPGTNSVGGFQFTGGSNGCKMIGCMSLTPIIINTTGIDTDTGAHLNPVVQIIGSTLCGNSSAVLVTQGGAYVVGTTFERCTNGVNFTTGTVSGAVIGCNFNVVNNPVVYANSTVQGLIAVIGNTGQGGTPIIPAQIQNRLTVPYLMINSATVDLVLNNPGAGADQKQWDIIPDSTGGLTFRMLNDAFTAANNWLGVTRSGYNPQAITLSAPTINLTGAVSATSLNNTPIGATTAAAGTFTNLTSTGTLNAVVANVSNNINLANGTANSPDLRWTTTGNGADQNMWDCYAGGGGLAFRALNDAFSGANSWLNVSRTGYVPQVIALNGTNVQLNAATVTLNTASGPTITSGAAAPASTQPQGSLYLRQSATAGNRLYVSAGGGTWNPVAGV
jgi:pectate lyase-like protein